MLKLTKLTPKAICLILASCIFAEISAQEVIPTPVEISVKSEKNVKIRKIDAATDTGLNLPDEGYTLDIQGNTAVLRSKTEQGLVWARATLEQLKDADGKVPQVKILDYPAFPIRGFMHDTGRNFRPVEILKKEIELFSSYKLNIFHWHLTDNPAWRIESRCYPQLNDPKYCPADRNPGMFYTYDEIRDVIAHAKKHGVTVIPELDIPGHSQYFMTIFGVQMETVKGMKILDALFEEFLEEIPAEDCPYIHIGSDEVRRKMPDPEGFVKHYEDMLAAHGRRPIVWNPGIKPSQSTICQIWGEGTVGSTADDSGRNPYIDSYMGYLNHGNLISNIRNNFLRQMCEVDKADEYALGGILCLWNDVRQESPKQIFPANGMPIAMLPFAERAWVGGSGYDREDLIEFEKKMAYHRDNFLRDWDIHWVANANIPWSITIPQAKGAKIEDAQWISEWGGSINLYKAGQANGVKFSNEMIAWLKTEIYSEEDREIRAWVSFETPSRSTRRSAGIGEQGKWETEGRILVNGEEVLPPSPWKEPGMYSYHFSTYGYPDIQNLPWTDEQLFWLREPARIKLRKGWNTVLMEAPLHYSTPFWFVSFTPVQIGKDGRLTEVEGLKYRQKNDIMMYGDTSRKGVPFSKDPHVVHFNGRYLMYHSIPPMSGDPASGWNIGIAESHDLVKWTKIGEITPDKNAIYEEKGLCAPCALVKDGQVHLFYQTYGNNRKDAICHAVSDDGINFRRNPTNPIFSPTGDWNCGRAIDAEVYEFKGKYFLYFATRDKDYKIQMQGVAVAPGDTDFSREDWVQATDAPILYPTLPWEGKCIEGASIIKRGDKLIMFYAGSYNNDPQQVGIAESKDGIVWERMSDEPFLANGKPGEWNSSESGHPHIFEAPDGRTYLFFQGNNNKGKTWFISQKEVFWEKDRPYLVE